ncbi:hypothetical protein KPH14_001136 [Odynerus spinipes]|uniref:Peptidase S1 domain-containing protein n=1 Tax=Odynerus spinipes TaxID=1348599 RepID=A0AAD9RQ45_9HYME|nr:hypothetical protein KPH14_001136 [Odynerus spinipes]
MSSLLRITSIAFLAFLSIVLRVHGQLYVGSPCHLNGIDGICTNLQKCTVIYNELLAGNQPGELCGFVNFEPLVCCPKNGQLPPKPTPRPTTTTTTTTTTSRTLPPIKGGRGAIARAKCQEYSKYVYQVQYGPVLSANSKPVNTSVCATKSKTLIVGGTKAIAREFPHMVAIGYDSDEGIGWKCGGSLISERYVMSAAHCSYSPGWGAAKWARVGDLNLNTIDDIAQPRDYKIVKRIKHPNYKAPAEYHDIALFRLDQDVTFNGFVRPACLQTTLPDAPDNKATATGWGLVAWTEDDGSNDLLKVTLNIVPQPSCNYSYSKSGFDVKLSRGVIDDLQICAGGLGKDTCQGDSGGPLATFSNDYDCMYNIIGITSLGRLCGTETPGIYTRVYNYIPWIESVVWGGQD